MTVPFGNAQAAQGAQGPQAPGAPNAQTQQTRPPRLLLGSFHADLGYAHAAQALDACKAVKARVLDAAKGQGLAHVGGGKVVEGRHARL